MDRSVSWRLLAGRVARLAAVLAVLAALIALGVMHPWQSPQQAPFGAKPAKGTLIVDFGLERVSLTRSILVPTGRAALSAPSILTARVSSDLIESPGLQQFPADQITLTATPVGSNQVEIVATLDPANPEKVASGLFKGTIAVYTGSRTLSVPLAVYLGPKSGYRATLAFLLLLLGAVFGLSVKWVTEALSSLAEAHWRLDGIRQRLGRTDECLPLSAAAKLDDLDNRVMRQDISQIDESFKPFDDASLLSLRKFCDGIDRINSIIRQQELLYGHLTVDNVSAADVIHAERERVDELKGRDWPWKNTQKILDNLQQLKRDANTVSSALKYGRGDVLTLFADDKFKEAREKYNNPPAKNKKGAGAGSQTEGAAQGASKTFGLFTSTPGVIRRWLRPSGLRSSPMTHWMTKHPRGLAATASVLVVAIVGLQLQYLDSTSFGGSLSDWLGLLLWSAVVELSGVSVLDVVGRLSGGGPASRSSRA